MRSKRLVLGNVTVLLAQCFNGGKTHLKLNTSIQRAVQTERAQ